MVLAPLLFLDGQLIVGKRSQKPPTRCNRLGHNDLALGLFARVRRDRFTDCAGVNLVSVARKEPFQIDAIWRGKWGKWHGRHVCHKLAPESSPDCTVRQVCSFGQQHGSGGIGLGALSAARDYVGIEINPTWAELARGRLADAMPLICREDPKLLQGKPPRIAQPDPDPYPR